MPFEELAVGPSSLIKEAVRGEQSADPSGNMCPSLAHLQNNSECHPGQKLSLGSDLAKLLITVARASVVTVTEKEMEKFWGVGAHRVTSVAMGSSAEGFGVIHIAARLYSQKSMACQKNK